MIRRPPRSTLFPLHDALPISEEGLSHSLRAFPDTIAQILGTAWFRPHDRRAKPCCSDRKSTRLNSSHGYISYAVFCLKKKQLTSADLVATTHRTPTHLYRRPH